MMADDTNVTQFPGTGEIPECPLQIKRRDNFCYHPRSFRLSAKQRGHPATGLAEPYRGEQ